MKLIALVVVLSLAAVCAVDAAAVQRSLRAALRAGTMSRAQVQANGDTTGPTIGFEGEMEHFKLVYIHNHNPQPWPIAKKGVWTTAGRTGPYDACPFLDITKDMCDGAGTYCTIEAITGCAPADMTVQKKHVKAMREFFRAVDAKARATTNADGIDMNTYAKIAKLDDVVAEYRKNVPTDMRLVLNGDFATANPAVSSGELFVAIEDKPDSATGIQVNFALKLARYGENRNDEIVNLFTSDKYGMAGTIHYMSMRACTAAYLAADHNSPLYAHRDNNHLKGFFTALGIYYAVRGIDTPDGGLVGIKNTWGLLVKNPLSDILRFIPDNAVKQHVLQWFNGLAGPSKAATFTAAFFNNACLNRYGAKNNQAMDTARTDIETAMTGNHEFENIFTPGNNRFAGETGTAYGSAYANAAAPDMDTPKNSQGFKLTHTDNPLAMMRINGEPAIVVEQRSGGHALKKGSHIKREDTKCHFYSLKKKCRKFEFDEDGLQTAIDLINAANA